MERKMPEMPSMEQLMQMAENAKAEIDKAQNMLDGIEVEGASGGGLVKVRATAKGRILNVAIDDSLMSVAEKPMLEDLLAAALNDARTKADTAANAEMQKMTSGILPPGFNL
jgi:nucleoid-associated protein EbfC